MNHDYSLLAKGLTPELALILAALAALGADLTLDRGRTPAARLGTSLALGFAGIVLSLGLCTRLGIRGPVYQGVLTLDSLALTAQEGILVLTALLLGVSCAQKRLRSPAEYVAIVLFACAGFMLMAAAQQLLFAFVCLELASICLYVLAGFDASSPKSAEAGVKYFLYGAMSAAFLLFGLSLIYGITGSLELDTISSALAGRSVTPLLAVALVMVLVAFGFKAAAAPFHLWAPDVYEGAPPASAALIASASKLGGFILFARLLCPGLGLGAHATTGSPGWVPILAVLVTASLFIGNLGALAQTNVRRLLAYSAIAHAGALMIGVMALPASGPAPLVYYAFTYGLSTVGAFGVVTVIDGSESCQSLTDLAGLMKRSPFLGSCLLVYVLSLAGVPPLAGFLGKFSVFAAALKVGGPGTLIGAVTLGAIAFSAVALYYYLAILKQVIVAPAAAGRASPLATPLAARVSLAAAAALLVILGLFPSLILGRF